MFIDWNKYVRILLPSFMRKPVLTEFIRSLTWQVPFLNSAFNVWADSAKYKANVNASVIALEKLIQREFDVLATITELDGQPTDFLVTIDGTVDDAAVKALVNQFKLAGKSYTFKLGTVSFTASFDNYVCEDIIELLSASFTDYVCEDDGNVLINTTLRVYSIDTFLVVSEATKNVASNVTITGNIVGYGSGGSQTFVASFSVTVASGTKTNQVNVSYTNTPGLVYAIDESSINISPASDSYYNYIKQ